MESQETGPFVADLGSELGIRQFSTLAEFQDAQQLEFQRFSQIAFAPVDSNRWDASRQQIARIINNAQGALRQRQQADADSYIRQAVQSWAQLYTSGVLLHSESAKGNFVIQLSAVNTQEAGGALSFFLGSIVSQDPQMHKGWVKALLWTQGLGGLEAAASKLADSQNQWNIFLSESSAASASREIDEAARIAGFEHATQVALSEMSRLRDAELQNARQLLDSSQKKLLELETTYRDKLALEYPVKYWLDEHARHHKYAVIFAWVFVSLLVVGGVSLAVTLHLFLNMKTPPFWRISVAASVGALVVWGIRVVAKLLFTNIQLATDAKERGTLIMTYLAMLTDTNTMKPEDRQIVLRSVFARSTGATSSTEELYPHTFHEFFTKFIKGG